MIRNKNPWVIAGLLAGAAALAACSSETVEQTPGEPVPAESSQGSTERSSEEPAIRYYIDKLPDRDFVESYGDAENPRPWYTAAEALGEIGKPAIPALITRLDTTDPYELKLALYALMLASQDPVLQAETNGDYLQLGTVLTEDTNAENRRLAMDWWQRYKHLWH